MITATQKFMVAGNATVTLTKKSNGDRFTYSIKAPSVTTDKGGRKIDREATIRFVSLMVTPDNEGYYQYLGNIFTNGMTYSHGRKSKIDWQAPSSKHFWRAWNYPDEFELHHEGKCGRCGRKLTVPASIESGYGPECVGKVA